MRLELTEMGRRWAQLKYDDSILARVALAGYDSDWPEGHVRLSTKICNEQGENMEPNDVQIYGAGV